MEKIIHKNEYKRLHYIATLQGVYSPGEEFMEFSINDIERGLILCSKNKYVIDANLYRVLWKIEPVGPNVLDKINPSELYEFFDEITKGDIMNSSKQNCSTEKFEVVLYYDMR